MKKVELLDLSDMSKRQAVRKAERRNRLTFLWRVCEKDEAHGSERYTSNGKCVVCVRSASNEARASADLITS